MYICCTMIRKWLHEGFSAKEKDFLLDYAKTDDLELSAKNAGYDETRIAWMGTSIMGKPGAIAELQLIKKELGLSTGTMELDELAKEFRIIGTTTITDFYDAFGDVMDVTEMDAEKAKAIKSIKRTVNPRNGAVTVELTMHDKISALQNLGRIGGHYAADDGGGKGDVNIQIVVPGGLGGL